MTAVSDDRWTCPHCQRTVIVTATPGDTQAALNACQRRHAAAHRAAVRLPRH